ncbi:MAG: ABC transporter permease [Bacteroidota bacterium]
MFRNYIKISFRNLWKHKSHVFINLMGLGVGIGMCILAYLTWKFDYDFDRMHQEADRIYRVTTTKQSNHEKYAVSPLPLAAASEEIVGVEESMILDASGVRVTNGEYNNVENVFFTKDNFLKWFNFPLVLGDRNLANSNNLLITERIAKKYFGESNPIGQTLTLYPKTNHQVELTITGVLQNLPLNSSIQFNFVTNIDNQLNEDGKKTNLQNWNRLVDGTFLVLKENAAPAAINEQLQTYLGVQNQANEDWKAERFDLLAVSEMAAHATELRWNMMRPNLNDALIWGSVLMGVMLLLTACFNFTSMMISLAGKRVKEMGLRKVMGGSRKQLIVQLLIEGFIMSVISLAIGILLLKLILPYYNQMWRELDLQLILWSNPTLIAFLVGMLLLTTFLAAFYPAFYISAFSPTQIFREKVKFSGSSLFSRILLGIQVTTAMMGLVIGITFSQNAKYQEETDLGFQKDGIQSIRTPNEQTFLAMKQAAEQSPYVEVVAGTRSVMGGGNTPRREFKLRGENQETDLMLVGKDYLELMEIEMNDGRSFDYNLMSDYERVVLVNEKFASDYFPNEDPIGQQIALYDTMQFTIAGVVKNFLKDGFFNPMRPLIIDLDNQPANFRYLMVKTQPENLLATRDYLEDQWKERFPYEPFEQSYQYDFAVYGVKITNNVKKMTLTMTIMSVLLLIAGFAALLSMDILKRLKEITIRRILGAQAPHVAYLLGNRFFLIVVLNLVFGGIVGMYVAQKVLDGIYEMHGGVSTQTVIIAALAMLLVVAITISTRLIGVLRNNPAKTLNS